MNPMRTTTTPLQPSVPLRAPLRTSIAAASFFGALVLAGCNRSEAPEAPPPAPATSAPATPAAGAPAPGSTSTPASSPSSSAPAPAAAPGPSSSATTPGTPDGAAASLPSSSQADAKPSDGTAVDAKETDPKAELTKREESKGMPEALQGNNHSSPALDPEPKKP